MGPSSIALRNLELEPFHTRLESMQALEGAYPEYPEITHHNLEHLYNVVVQVRPPSGGYGKGIDIVRRKRDGFVCVRKTFLLSGKAKPRRWLREVKAVRVLKHQNIEGYIEAAISPIKGEIFLEYCNLGNLDHVKTYMVKNHIGISENFVWHVFKDLFKALCYMHYGLEDEKEILEEGNPGKYGWIPVLHRDIKLDNIFLKSPDIGGDYPIVKLGDFGMGMSKKDLKMPFATSGTEGWMAPEFPNCSPRSDVFSATAVIQCLTMPNWTEANAEGGVGPHYSSELEECVLFGMTRAKVDRPRAREVAEMVFTVDREEEPFSMDVPEEAFDRYLPPKEKN